MEEANRINEPRRPGFSSKAISLPGLAGILDAVKSLEFDIVGLAVDFLDLADYTRKAPAALLHRSKIWARVRRAGTRLRSGGDRLMPIGSELAVATPQTGIQKHRR